LADADLVSIPGNYAIDAGINPGEDAAAAGRRSLLSAEEAVDLVTSPLGGADPLALLRLRRAARRVAPELPGSEGLPADDVIATLLLDPASSLLDDPDLAPVRRVAAVLRAGLAHLTGDGGDQRPDAETLLWTLWDRSGLSRAWEEQALAGGAAGERADRDLDAVMVLFGAAADYVERLPGMGPAGFASHVAALDLGADSLAARGHRADAVAVLTPQAAAGQEWDRVAVVGVQEGVWPDLRLRDSLLGAEALVAVLHGRSVSGTEGLRAAQEQVRADELRQFYTALTRAREQLLVTAVASPDEQPSTLLDLVDPREEDRSLAEVPPPLTLRGLVATLRRELVRAHREGDRPARDEAARVLRELVAAGVPGADPRHWWQVRDVSDPRPVQPTGPVPVSPSRVQGFSECGLRWLLTSRGGERPRQHAAAVGTLVHDIVAEQPRAGLADLQAELERRWHQLGLGDGWVARRERERATDMLRRYVAYVDGAEAHGWRLVGTELAVDATVDRARVTGRVDRLERHDDGRLRVVDLKTGASKPAAKELARHPQLGTYQVALVEGGVQPEATGEHPDPSDQQAPAIAGEPGGAVLVQLGRAAGRGPSVQPQPPLDQDEDPRWAHHLVTATAEGMGSARFPATSGSWCRTCPVTASCPLQPEGREWR
ncbi:PD-(D/E)XK nuclease family protein, partial [Ornithinicoccus halotolerans]|uniref:PD-(D/E)XK nuclease family protein n=1 Tax=Ornithinicoccus halotolerans TaxID=1748220 RepID=UPI001885D2F7